jgi:hypothetical protein
MNFLVIVYVLVTIFQSFSEASRTPKIEFRSSFIADSVLARTLFRSLKLRTQERRRQHGRSITFLSDWSNFSVLEDDDDFSIPSRTTQYASENDSQEYKAQIGNQIPNPEILVDYVDPIFVPQGSLLELSFENVQGVLAACRQEIGTMFGYSPENRGVGITGAVDFVDLDGPNVVLRLRGRFWHQRPTVLARVGAYIKGRIPEVVDVVIEDPYQLTDEANDASL